MIIQNISARKIKDSRDNETIEVSVNNSNASSPSGKSTGKYESREYLKNLDWNVNFLNLEKSFLIGLEIKKFEDLEIVEKKIIKELKLKKVQEFGANSLFALESVILKALAVSEKKELWEIINPKAKKIPIPLGNIIGGGLHSSKFKNHTNFQEFLIIPFSKKFEKNYNIMKKIYLKIGEKFNLKKINDEGAWQTEFDEEKILEILSEFKREVRIGIDVASTHFYKNKFYDYKNKKLNEKNQIFYINNLIKKYKIFYIEDPLYEEDFNGFSKINKKSFVCGDDLTATQINRLKKSIEKNSINCMITKPNQNGSLIELKEIISICKKNNIKTVMSHRSGETTDNSLADYAFGFQTDFIKTGIATKWREVKLNRLEEIEKSLKNR